MSESNQSPVFGNYFEPAITPCLVCLGIGVGGKPR